MHRAPTGYSTNPDGIQMSNTGFRIKKVHGLIFDGATFLGNAALFSAAPRLGDDADEFTAGLLVLLAVLTQLAGAWWKQGFLAQRLTRSMLPPSKGPGRGFLNLLVFSHFILFSVMTVFAFGLLGIYQMNGSGGFFRGEVWIIIGFLLGGFTTYRVWVAEPRKNTPAEARPVSIPALEFGADGLLWVSVSLVTRIFWDGLVALIEPASGIGISGDGLMLLGAMAFLFVVFYLPGRYLFLVEDYHSRRTWVQVGLAILPVLWLVMVG